MILIFLFKPQLPFGPNQKALQIESIMDVEYAKDSPSQVLDIYIPKNEVMNKIPVIIYVHGGAFAAGDKNSPLVAPKFLENGYAVVSANYRLSDEAQFPAAVQDVKSAVRWVKANSGAYNIDSEKIGVIGDSAGGTLVSLIGLTSGVEEFETNENKDYADNVNAVVDMYGLADFSMIRADCQQYGCVSVSAGKDSFLTKYLGCDLNFATCDETAKKASPITYISKEAPPFFIIHGNKDKSVPIIQSIRFAQGLNETGRDVTFIIAEGYGHESKIFTDNSEQIINFFNKHLK